MKAVDLANLLDVGQGSVSDILNYKIGLNLTRQLLKSPMI